MRALSTLRERLGQHAHAILGLLLFGLLCWLVTREFAWLGTDLWTAISHGPNEDWDWQLTLYEASRKSLVDYLEIPGWTPYTQGGVPLLANPESPFLYPPFALILLLGTQVGLKLWILLHLYLLLAAGWLLGRDLELEPSWAHGVGIAVVFSAFVPEFIAYGHIMYLPLCWLPLAAVAWRRGWWRLCAASLLMSLLGGGHYIVVYGFLWIGLQALFEQFEPSRLLYLALWLVAELLLLGQGWAFWPMLPLLLVALALQRPRAEARPLRALGLLSMVLLLCLLAGALKLTTVPTLWARAERLAPQGIFSIADPYDIPSALGVLSGLLERPSGHEGQNVFYTPLPLILAAVGFLPAFRKNAALSLTGLVFLVLGWSGSVPVNLAALLHRLPPFDHFRVVERYSLVWTLFLGLFAAFGARLLWNLERPLLRWSARVILALALFAHLRQAHVEVSKVYQLGVGAPHIIPEAGEFVQVDDELTNWEALRANRGKPRFWTTAWLKDPGPVKVLGEEGYRGELWLEPRDTSLGTWLPVESQITPNHLRFDAPAAGWLVVNQNAFDGWVHEGRAASSREGLLTVEVAAGEGKLDYRPPGLIAGLVATFLGLLLLVLPLPRALRASVGEETP